MGKITSSYTGGFHFTFILSMDDCRIVTGIVTAWRMVSNMRIGLDWIRLDRIGYREGLVDGNEY